MRSGALRQQLGAELQLRAKLGSQTMSLVRQGLGELARPLVRSRSVFQAVFTPAGSGGAFPVGSQFVAHLDSLLDGLRGA